MQSRDSASCTNHLHNARARFFPGRVYEASGAIPYRTRSLEQYTSYFGGLELIEPGVVLVADWRPDPGADRGPEIPQEGAVGRKR